MNRLSAAIQWVFFLVLLLYWGRSLFVPLSFALLNACLLFPISRWFEQKKWPLPMAILTAHLLLFLPLVGLVALFLGHLQSFAAQWPNLKEKLSVLLQELSLELKYRFKIPIEFQEHWLRNLMDSSGGKILPFLGNTTLSLSVAVVIFLLVPVLSALILYHRRMLVAVLFSIFPDMPQATIRIILLESITSYYSFVKGMALVYFIVACLNSAGLAILGIPQALFFGTVASLLTFIPYLGIVVASILPMSVAWIAYNSLWHPFGVAVVFALVQIIEANVIFPMAISNRLKINTLVTILAILLGGIIWGAAGMVLFIPFLGILKLVADRIPEWRTLSLLLGTGEEPDRK